MSSDRIVAESKVSGNQANIPARIRRELEIDDGDQSNSRDHRAPARKAEDPSEAGSIFAALHSAMLLS